MVSGRTWPSVSGRLLYSRPEIAEKTPNTRDGSGVQNIAYNNNIHYYDYYYDNYSNRKKGKIELRYSFHRSSGRSLIELYLVTVQIVKIGLTIYTPFQT